ncbi:MAG: hypothetical protein GTO41_16805, partial [Burkholderiales bacterium]|nr:hypothetical protein [Burkholderiales bacterium]
NRITSGPAVNTNNTGGFGAAGESLYVLANFDNTLETITYTIDFAHPNGVTDIDFQIFDIDGTSSGFRDQVRVTARDINGNT